MLSRFKFEIEGLFQEMYEKLPEYVFTREGITFADLQAAGLQAIVPIVNKLRENGRSDEYIRSHVFAFCEDELDLNSVQGEFLDLPFTLDIYRESIDMKFDVVVGNPPYQDNESERGINGGSNKKLWMVFLNKSLELTKEDGYVAILVPSTWAAGSKNPHNNTNIFQDIIKKKNIININMDENKHFNVGIEISSIVMQNSESSNNNIKLNGVNFDIENLDILPKNCSSIVLSIFDKIKNLPKMKFEFVRKNFKKSELNNIQIGEFIHPTYIGKDGIKYSSSQTKFDNNRKILVHRMSYGSGGLQPYLDDNGTLTPSYSNVYLLNDNQNGDDVIKIMESRFYKFLFQNLKYTQYNEPRALSHLPKVENIKGFSDNEIFDYFKLNEEEINYVLQNS